VAVTLDGMSSDGVRLRPALLAAGYTDEELRALRRRQQIVAVRPGAYVQSDDERLRTPEARHRLEVRAALPHINPDAVVSHASAAVLHGLALWSTPLDRVHVTRRQSSGGRRTSRLHVHPAALNDDEIVVVDGILVTSVARTIIDLARSLTFEAAVVPADFALHRHLVDRATLAAVGKRTSHRRGNTRARRVVAFADPGAASPGESRSRVAIARAGLPPPRLQYPVRSRHGVVLGYADFAWEEFRTLGEFDGRTKYSGGLLKPGQDPGDVVFAEKRREDSFRDEAWRVVRWTTADLSDFAPP
jgi:hypothetical protein